MQSRPIRLAHLCEEPIVRPADGRAVWAAANCRCEVTVAVLFSQSTHWMSRNTHTRRPELLSTRLFRRHHEARCDQYHVLDHELTGHREQQWIVVRECGLWCHHEHQECAGEMHDQ